MVEAMKEIIKSEVSELIAIPQNTAQLTNMIQ